MQFEFEVLAANQLNLKPSCLFFSFFTRFDLIDWRTIKMMKQTIAALQLTAVCLCFKCEKKVYLFIIHVRTFERSNITWKYLPTNDLALKMETIVFWTHVPGTLQMHETLRNTVIASKLYVCASFLFILWTTCLLIKMEYHENGIKAAATNWLERVFFSCVCVIILFPHISLELDRVGRVGLSFNLLGLVQWFNGSTYDYNVVFMNTWAVCLLPVFASWFYIPKVWIVLNWIEYISGSTIDYHSPTSTYNTKNKRQQLKQSK